MKPYIKQFLGFDPSASDWKRAAVAVLPFPYEEGVSYGRGARRAPDAIIEASAFLELYDEILEIEPYHMGIFTVTPPDIPKSSPEMVKTLYLMTKILCEHDKFVVLLGGDHSISTGYFKALQEKYGTLSAIQIDAHCDLRDSYGGSKFSHACVMSRIREMTPHTLQIGIRSMSMAEAEKIKKHRLPLATMHGFRSGAFDLDEALSNLPNQTYLTVDVDAFDWSIIASTGTPEPGGISWDEAMALLKKIFFAKNIVGFDVVELSFSETDRNSPFAVAKLVYKMLGFKLAAAVSSGKIHWPSRPEGPLFY